MLLLLLLIAVDLLCMLLFGRKPDEITTGARAKLRVECKRNMKNGRPLLPKLQSLPS